MRIFRDIESVSGQITNAVVCVGSFDGVHLGHCELIKQMNQRAREIGGQSVVVTFDPHPRQVLKGANRLLTDTQEKLQLLEQTGVDNVLLLTFTREFSQLEYDTFIKKYLIDTLKAKIVFSAQGHFFGKDKQGTHQALQNFGLEVHHIQRIGNISSTAIRDAIDNNNIQLARQMLGHNIKILSNK